MPGYWLLPEKGLGGSQQLDACHMLGGGGGGYLDSIRHLIFIHTHDFALGKVQLVVGVCLLVRPMQFHIRAIV